MRHLLYLQTKVAAHIPVTAAVKNCCLDIDYLCLSSVTYLLIKDFFWITIFWEEFLRCIFKCSVFSLFKFCGVTWLWQVLQGEWGTEGRCEWICNVRERCLEQFFFWLKTEFLRRQEHIPSKKNFCRFFFPSFVMCLILYALHTKKSVSP